MSEQILDLKELKVSNLFDQEALNVRMNRSLCILDKKYTMLSL